MKEHILWEKDYIWNPATRSFENGKHLASIIDDSVITCDEIVKETKTIPTILMKKKYNMQNKKFYILLGLLLITIALLIPLVFTVT